MTLYFILPLIFLFLMFVLLLSYIFFLNTLVTNVVNELTLLKANQVNLLNEISIQISEAQNSCSEIEKLSTLNYGLIGGIFLVSILSFAYYMNLKNVETSTILELADKNFEYIMASSVNSETLSEHIDSKFLNYNFQDITNTFALLKETTLKIENLELKLNLLLSQKNAVIDFLSFAPLDLTKLN